MNPNNALDPFNQNLNAPTDNSTKPKSKATPDKKSLMTQIGRSGTYNFGGIITQEEYNTDLTRWNALKAYDVMRRSDATVGAAMHAVKLPLLSSSYTIQPDGDTPSAIKKGDFIRQELFGRNITWNAVMREILTNLDFGYSVFEIICEYCDFEGQRMIGLAAIQSRKQRSIFRWLQEDGTPGVTQYVPGGTYSIPWEKLAIFTNEQEGDNYEGISKLRTAYKPWSIKDALDLGNAIKLERQGLGIVEVSYLPGTQQDEINKAIEAARQARMNEESVIAHPAGDIVVAWMDMMAHTTADILPTIQYQDRQILKAVLAQFIDLGASSGSGSRAVSQDHSKLFVQSLEAVAKQITDKVNSTIIKRLIDLNFSDQSEYPTLEHSKIGDEDVKSLADAVAVLVTAQALTPDADMEQALRTSLHMPDLPDEYKNDYANRPVPKVGGSSAPSVPGQLPTKPSTGNSQVSSHALEGLNFIKANLIKELTAEYEHSNN